ncbi:PA domain-containing protein [Albimonas donghaensis]|uniref:Carboxypeptidase Q n=1 Tax=Albimonas donghaensis TaxID=356660 RepID=A0A1H3DM98_9RHOB|nr:M28 family peptidase [Albimonas donghaensis]SDX66779.1 PA domain-containing protein [Albimonas donghaensis]
MTDARFITRAFEAICDCGGRLCGTESERAATALLHDLGAEAAGAPVRAEPFAYRGWRPLSCALETPAGPVPAHPLVRSAGGEVEAEVIDLGRGEPESFAAHADEIRGRIALVRHELMFNPGTLHRRIKYRAAVEAGAVGFLIAGPAAGGMVAGSSGRGDEPGIPAFGISPETAAAFARTSAGRPVARMSLETEEFDATADNLFVDLPGAGPETVVLCAHIDGHDLGESAIDNAAGLAVALEAARRIAADRPAGGWRRGLRLAFFNAEEWALTGSARHLDGLTAAERAGISLCVNIDSPVGGAGLAALTCGAAGIEPMLLRAAEARGETLRLHRPFQANSDHANFARAGIPGFRLVAGFGEHDAAARLVLTPFDRRDLVSDAALRRAADLAETITRAALDANDAEAASWRAGMIEAD